MGGAAMIGLGLALAKPSVKVAVITGDGEMLMGMGSLATIGVQRPANLAVIVFDNQHYGETGMQASHTDGGVDLVGVARACGIKQTLAVQDRGRAEQLAGAARLVPARRCLRACASRRTSRRGCFPPRTAWNSSCASARRCGAAGRPDPDRCVRSWLLETRRFRLVWTGRNRASITARLDQPRPRGGARRPGSSVGRARD